jgi:hypothetical protein
MIPELIRQIVGGDVRKYTAGNKQQVARVFREQRRSPRSK